jgi:hypothetical protein
MTITRTYLMPTIMRDKWDASKTSPRRGVNVRWGADLARRSLGGTSWMAGAGGGAVRALEQLPDYLQAEKQRNGWTPRITITCQVKQSGFCRWLDGPATDCRSW